MDDTKRAYGYTTSHFNKTVVIDFERVGHILTDVTLQAEMDFCP